MSLPCTSAVWPAKEELKQTYQGGCTAITVVIAAKPVRAGIDPRYLLIDADPTDNMKEAAFH